jgi:K+-transporting ATPase ATPase B chain
MHVLKEALLKFNPRRLYRNPVMFLTEIGAFVASLELVLKPDWFSFQIVLWLWLTVFFANVAEAIAERRNRAAADSLRSERVETMARLEDGKKIGASDLKKGDIVIVRPGETIPGDGEIIRGIAAIDEAAVTGESAAMIRAAGSDNSSVMAGTKVLSDEIVVRIASHAGEGFVDRMIHLIEGCRRKKTHNEIALTILLSGLTFIFLTVVATMKIFGSYFQINMSITMLVSLLVCLIPTTIASLLGAIGIAGINRLMKKHVLAMSGQAVEAAGDIDVILLDKTGTITYGNRRAVGIRPAPGVSLEELASACLAASSEDPTIEGRSLVEWIEQNLPHVEKKRGGTFVPFTAATRMSGVDGEGGRVRKGAADAIANFLNIPLPFEVVEEAKKISETGGTPLLVASQAKLLGTIHLKDVVKEGLPLLFSRFRAMGIRSILITGDNAITAQAIGKEAGVDEVIAGATPEEKLKALLRLQNEGHLVAMTGDGLNDAPALAHANVGLAMNSGTQAAKEAGNMIDLESHPMKLFEILEIGKQMLMTRGALTTFSVANDIAKYFAVIPALLIPFFPVVAPLNLMGLSSPSSAVLSAIIFNAIIIVFLIPLALAGVKVIPERAHLILKRNLTVYGLGGILLPFIGIKLIDLLVVSLGLL